MAYSILVIGVVGDTAEVSTSFLSTLLRLQQHLHTVQDQTKVSFEFSHSVRDALTYFESSTADRLVLVDGLMGIDVEWILKQHTTQPVVVAAYPLREINWERVSQLRAQGVTNSDTLRRESYVYNFDSDTKDCDSDSYLNVESAQAKIVSLSKEGIQTFLSGYDPYTKRLSNTVIDLSAKGINSGPFDFVGCVGTRLVANQKA